MRKIVFFLLLISLILPMQFQAGAAEESNPAGVTTGKKKSSAKKPSDKKQSSKKQKGKKSAGKKTAGPKTETTRLLPPTPLTPADAATLQSGAVGFRWKGSSGTSSYRIQVSSNPTFASTSIDDATASVTYDAREALTPGTYYWRVQAMDALKKNGIWSAVGKFTVDDGDPFTATTVNFTVASTNTTSVSLAISAASKNNIAGYYVSESPVAPEANTPGWIAAASSNSYASTIPYTLSRGDGVKTVYVWFLDAAGHLSTAASTTISLNTRAPSVTITDHPASSSNVATATFSFVSPIVGSTFQCKLDAGSYSTCTSPVRYTSLTEEKHTFTVRMVDAAGNVTSFPAGYTWGVGGDLPLQNTTPSGFINRGGAYFTDKNPVTLSISASAKRDAKITAYLASESPIPPDASDQRWITVHTGEVYSDDVEFTLSDGSGKKTVSVWFKDTANNVSGVKSDTIYVFNSKRFVIMFLLLQAVFIFF